ncbi:hypothetical protein KJ786_02540 [Patescibacteria group bacterium]|nr:hypothetical protein [Patescibacteria group bacterium]
MAYSKNPNLPRVRMKAVSLVRKGWSIIRAARYFGFSHGALINWLKKAPRDGRLTIPTEDSSAKHHPSQWLMFFIVFAVGFTIRSIFIRLKRG